MSKIKFLMMALIAVVSMTFTACGGDDGDNTPGKDYSVVGTWEIIEVPGNENSGLKVGDIIVITSDGKIYDEIDQLGTWKKGGQCTLTDSEAYPVPFTAKVLSLTETFMSVDISIYAVTFNMKLKRLSSTADGGDDDDTTGVVPGGGSTPTTGNMEFVVPCLSWTWTKEQVKEYMAGDVWTLQTDAAYELMYEKQNGIKIVYTFGSGDSWNPHTGLDAAGVTYKNTKVDDFQWLVDKTQKQYNVKMDVYEDKGYNAAEVTFNLDGKDIQIIISRNPTGEMLMKWMLL